MPTNYIRSIIRKSDPKDSLDIKKTSRYICQAYIREKLMQRNLMSVKMDKYLKSTDKIVNYQLQVLVNILIRVGNELERSYPDLYSDLASHLGVTYYPSVDVTGLTYLTFCENFTRTGMTWVKMVGLLAMANVFAMDCIQRNQEDVVSTVVESFTEFVSSKLNGWIKLQNGWVMVGLFYNFSNFILG